MPKESFTSRFIEGLGLLTAAKWMWKGGKLAFPENWEYAAIFVFLEGASLVVPAILYLGLNLELGWSIATGAGIKIAEAGLFAMLKDTIENDNDPTIMKPPGR